MKLATADFNIFTHERKNETTGVPVLLFCGSDVSARVQRSRPGGGLKQRGAVYVVIRESAMVSLARGWLHILAQCGR